MKPAIAYLILCAFPLVMWALAIEERIEARRDVEFIQSQTWGVGECYPPIPESAYRFSHLAYTHYRTRAGGE